MSWHLTETQAQILKGTLKGTLRGGAAGATAAIASGAAVFLTTPAWVPFVGGSMLIAAGTLAAWTAAGSGAGALTGGVWACVRAKRQDARFRQMFGD